MIQWPEGDFKNRGKSKESEKIQANMYLDFLETNDLVNIINTPTRQSNILDLFTVNVQDNYELKDTIINKKISDHNLMNITIKSGNSDKESVRRVNPYSNIIYEYDTDSIGDEWNNFENAITNEDWDINANLPSEDQILKLYELLNDNAIKFLKKKKCFEDSMMKEKRKYIPTVGKRLFRKKLKLCFGLVGARVKS